MVFVMNEIGCTHADMAKEIIKAAKSGDQAALKALIAVDMNLSHRAIAMARRHSTARHGRAIVRW